MENSHYLQMKLVIWFRSCHADRLCQLDDEIGVTSGLAVIPCESEGDMYEKAK